MSPMTGRERCLAAIRGEPVDRTPVFPLLMFFAQERAGITYRQFATDGEAMAAAQVAISERFPIDAITACSDAFRITADLGADMVFPEDRPPFAARPLVTCRADLERLRRPDPAAPGSRCADRTRGTAAMVRAVGDRCLVLGWVDMPFAECCSLCGITEFMMMLVDEPRLAHDLLDFVTGIVIDFARMQVAAGAPMIGAGDAAASLLSPARFREFALPFEQRVAAAVHDAGALLKLHICGNTTHLLPDMLQSGADLFNVDHLVDFDHACTVYGNAGRCFKGNLDPVRELLQSTPAACAARCRELLDRAAGLPYMLSAGCEIPAATPDDVFATFCAAPDGRGE